MLIIADSTANPQHVAADLLAQAEHDPMAAAVLITTEDALAQAVVIEVEKAASAASPPGADGKGDRSL